MIEEWEPIKGFDRHQFSNTGKVKRVRSPYLTFEDYLVAEDRILPCSYKDGKILVDLDKASKILNGKYDY